MQNIELVNRQRKRKINQKLWIEFSLKAVQSIVESKNKSVTIAFVSDKKMRELNKDFRGVNSTTDVLSFPFEAEDFESEGDNLGDIIISVEQAARQAVENNLDFETEIKQLILHGVLHLGGYDHETDGGEMNKIELKYRETLEI